MQQITLQGFTFALTLTVKITAAAYLQALLKRKCLHVCSTKCPAKPLHKSPFLTLELASNYIIRLVAARTVKYVTNRL